MRRVAADAIQKTRGEAYVTCFAADICGSQAKHCSNSCIRKELLSYTTTAATRVQRGSLQEANKPLQYL